MKKLVFGEGLLNPTLAGEKKITLRKYRPEAHDFIEGEIVIGEFKEGLSILLYITQNTEKKPFSQMTYEEARRDGFIDQDDAFENLKEYYTDLKKTDTLATIRYEVLNINNVPVASLNEHA